MKEERRIKEGEKKAKERRNKREESDQTKNRKQKNKFSLTWVKRNTC